MNVPHLLCMCLIFFYLYIPFIINCFVSLIKLIFPLYLFIFAQLFFSLSKNMKLVHCKSYPNKPNNPSMKLRNIIEKKHLNILMMTLVYGPMFQALMIHSLVYSKFEWLRIPWNTSNDPEKWISLIFVFFHMSTVRVICSTCYFLQL